jgi:hypothetical protein
MTTILQLGFVEPKLAVMAPSASSGPAQSQDQTKASRPEPLNFPLFLIKLGSTYNEQFDGAQNHAT